MSSTKNGGRRSTEPARTTAWLTAVAGVSAALVAIAGIYWLNHPDTEGCSGGILVDGRTLNLDAAIKNLHLNTAATPTAQAVITERLQFYLTRSTDLCHDRDHKRLSPQQYVARRDQVADWYMGVARAAQLGRFSQVEPDQADALREAINSVSITLPVAILAKVTLTNKDGLIVPTGATVHDGEQLKLGITTSKPTFLYVVGFGSSGRVERIFPSRLSRRSNPMQGELKIPENPDQYIGVHGAPGMERIYVFAGDKVDAELEHIGEIAGLGQKPTDPARAVRRQIVVRDLFADPAAPPRPASGQTPMPQDLRGQLGTAALEIDLNHVP